VGAALTEKLPIPITTLNVTAKAAIKKEPFVLLIMGRPFMW